MQVEYSIRTGQDGYLLSALPYSCLLSSSSQSVKNIGSSSLPKGYYSASQSQRCSRPIRGPLLTLSRFFPSIACLSHWFRKKRAIAMGIAYSGSSMGGVLWPIIMSHILNNPNLGFKWALRIAGFINVLPQRIFPNFRSQLLLRQISHKRHVSHDVILGHFSISNSLKIPHILCLKSDSS